METCVCAAIRLRDGTTICGRRHHDCILAVKDARGGEQGFITTLGRFVDRKEGLRLQLAAGVPSARGAYKSKLFSEDLY